MSPLGPSGRELCLLSVWPLTPSQPLHSPPADHSCSAWSRVCKDEERPSLGVGGSCWEKQEGRPGVAVLAGPGKPPVLAQTSGARPAVQGLLQGNCLL